MSTIRLFHERCVRAPFLPSFAVGIKEIVFLLAVTLDGQRRGNPVFSPSIASDAAVVSDVESRQFVYDEQSNVVDNVAGDNASRVDHGDAVLEPRECHGPGALTGCTRHRH